MKTEKNYLFKENTTELQYFCQVQVSHKFMKTADAQERELLDWMERTLAHRTATQEQVWQVHDELVHRLVQINDSRCDMQPFLVLSFQPLRKLENGWIRIERSSGRHQCVLLPIIDCRGQLQTV
jgi:hypothetical protein